MTDLGMKEAELLTCAHCSLCTLPIGTSGLLSFFRLKLEWWGIEPKAFLGMVPEENPDLAKPVQPTQSLIVCATCATKPLIVGDLVIGRGNV